MDSNQKFLALGLPRSWHFSVLIEVHDKLGHQGFNRTYHLIKCQYYWRGMNKDIANMLTIVHCVRGKKQGYRYIPFK